MSQALCKPRNQNHRIDPQHRPPDGINRLIVTLHGASTWIAVPERIGSPVKKPAYKHLDYSREPEKILYLKQRGGPENQLTVNLDLAPEVASLVADIWLRDASLILPGARISQLMTGCAVSNRLGDQPLIHRAPGWLDNFLPVNENSDHSVARAKIQGAILHQIEIQEFPKAQDRLFLILEDR